MMRSKATRIDESAGRSAASRSGPDRRPGRRSAAAGTLQEAADRSARADASRRLQADADSSLKVPVVQCNGLEALKEPKVLELGQEEVQLQLDLLLLHQVLD